MGSNSRVSGLRAVCGFAACARKYIEGYVFPRTCSEAAYRPRSRPMSSFMISFDPAQIFVTRASFHARAARYSFM